jgi:alkylhydroperoxidase family enzyme
MLGATLSAVVLFAVAVGNSQVPSAQSPEVRGHLSAPRIKPLEEPEWSAAQKEVVKPGVSNTIKTCLYNLEMCRHFQPFVSYFVDPSTLPSHDKEVLVLRTAWLCKADYEWNAHVRRGKSAGMNDAYIAAIIEGPQSSKLNSSDMVLVRMADELHSHQFVSDATWNSLVKMYETPQVLEAVFTVGQYTLLAMYQKSMGIPNNGRGPFIDLPIGQ